MNASRVGLARRFSSLARAVSLASVLVAAAACGSDGRDGTAAAERSGQAAVLEGGQRPIRPRGGMPIAPRSEVEQLAEIGRLVEAKGAVRVVIRFEGLMDPVPAPNFDFRSKRSDVKRPVDKIAVRRVQTAQAQVLGELPANPRRRVTPFEFVPYLALDMNSSDVRALAQWIVRVPAGSATRPYSMQFEASSTLRRQAAVQGTLGVTVETAANYMKMSSFTAPTSPSTIVVIDDRVDAALHLLHDQIDAVAVVTAGPAEEIPLPATPMDPADPANPTLSHGTKVALIAATAAPNARLVAIDVFGGYPDSHADYIANALQHVIAKWAQDPNCKLAAVSISLGDENMSAATSCDCVGTNTAYVGCRVLEPLLRDHVNLLAQLQVPVVVSAGNESIFQNEVFYPACLSTVVTVGATGGGANGAKLAKAGVSNWSPLLDVCAQGENLFLKLDSWVVPPTSTPACSFSSGTSFAAPFVAAGFSLLLDRHPEANWSALTGSLAASDVYVVYNGITIQELDLQSASDWIAHPSTPAPAPTPPPIDHPVPPPGPSSPH